MGYVKTIFSLNIYQEQSRKTWTVLVHFDDSEDEFHIM